MVLALIRRAPVLGAAAMATLAANPASAQELDRAAALIEAPREYDPTPIRIGAAALGVGLDLRGEYIDNLYALPENEIDDFRLTVLPRANLLLEQQRYRVALRAQANVRRHADNVGEQPRAFLQLHQRHHVRHLLLEGGMIDPVEGDEAEDLAPPRHRREGAPRS